MFTSDIAVRYLHFLAILVMFAMLTTQHLLLRNPVDPKWLKKCAVLDMIYGLAALATFLAGLGLWFWVGKPAGFYSGNWVFHTKISLFVLAALISFVPTRFLLRLRKAGPPITVPKSVTLALRLELLLLIIIPFLAVMMANGVGYVR